MVKIVEAIKHASENRHHFVSFEFIAPTTEAGLITLYDRIERFSTLDPLFCGITWGDGGQTAETSIEVASTCRSLLSVNYQVNLTGYTSAPEEVLRWLSVLKAKGVRNLLLTRGAGTGEPGRDAAASTSAPRSSVAADTTVDAAVPRSEPSPPSFPHAKDLVAFVRQHFGDYFGIAVVAFPEGEGKAAAADGSRLAAVRQQMELSYLKAKVDAGADYIVTQSVFSVEAFDQFCSSCRRRGIRCPILPGVLPVSHPRQLDAPGQRHLAGTSELRRRMVATAGDAAETRRAVVAFYQALIQQLLERECGGVYFFTRNVDTLLLAILKGIEVATHRVYPWRPSENEERRRQETVRPVHWSSRVTSYMVRTAQWRASEGDRWNMVSGPRHGSGAIALGEAGGYHARLLLRSRAKRCTQFLALQGMPEMQVALAELSRIFVAFLDGHGTLPWADALSGETAYVGEDLLKPLNARGLYTINSQPSVNGVPSSDRVVGWGPGDGCVYQKNYVEFFCPLTAVQSVLTTLEKYPSLQYMAMNAQGAMVRARWRVDDGATAELAEQPIASTAASPSPKSSMALFGAGVTTVTWGVFPGRTVIQPTIVSVDSFRAWVGEAFELWAAPFPGNDVPAVVRYIQTEWVLVSVVDNIFQESPTPLAHAVVDICSKMPPLTPIGGFPPRLSPGAMPATEANGHSHLVASTAAA